MNKKIDELINKMTLKEKAKIVSGYKSWHTNAIKRLNIPSICLTDGPIGVRKKDESQKSGLGLGKSFPSTSFPTSVNIANSFNSKNAYLMGKAIGQECEIYDVQVILGPALNIKRDPRCGRNFEYYSEDPVLSGTIAGNVVNGIQSQNVAACMKHYAANNSENFRYMGSSMVDERALREIYLKSFEICNKISNPKTVMCGYNQINGTHCSENNWLINEVLRNQYGFNGLVMTDWGATKDRVKGVQAGIDLDMPGDIKYNQKQIIKAIKNKSLSEKDLNTAVKNVLNLVYSFKKNKEFSNKEKEFIFKDNNKLALNIALDSAVLMKNENNILPIKKEEKVLVVGELFSKMRYQGAGSSSMNPYKLVTSKDAFEKNKVKYEYVLGYKENTDEVNIKLEQEVLEKADNFDKIIFFGGLTELFESEGYDRETLSLPNNQLSLLNKLSKKHNVICVMFGGSPFEMPFNNDVKAILNMFLPGQAGGEAVRKLLYGEVSPSGRLSETWMKTVDDIPFGENFSKNYLENYKENIFVGYRYFDNVEEKVLYPFGHGLSYSSFKYTYKTLKLEDGIVTVKVEVKNVGDYDSSEVIQLYVGKNKNSQVFKANKELKAFSKVFIKKNESKEVVLTFKVDDLAYYNVKENRFVVENGLYPIYIATSSKDVKLTLEMVVANKEDVNSPYSQEVTKAYNNISCLENITDEVFNETINNKKVLKYGIDPFTLETPLFEFEKTKKGKKIYDLIMKIVVNTSNTDKIKNPEERELVEKNNRFMLALIPKNSLRSLSQSSSGMLPINLAKALLELANGHVLKALVELIFRG